MLVVGLGAVVVLAAVAGTPVDRAVVIGALGVAVTIVGSGIGRWQGDRRLVGSGGGDVVRSSARLWPLVALGVLVVIVGVGDGWRRRRALGPGRVGAALAGLATEALGFVVLAATMGDVVVGMWIEGRPRRHRGRLVRDEAVLGTVSDGCGTKPCRERAVAAAWMAAAHDEAAAVDAFLTLAGRLERGAATAPDLAPTLRAIARDERAHAALGADVVRWCAGQRPRLVPAAVRAAARRVPARTTLPAVYAGTAPADLRAAGLVDAVGAAEVWAAERAAAAALLGEGPQGRGRGPAQ